MLPKKIVIGTVVGVVSSATQSVDLTLQRKSHIQEDLITSADSRRPPYQRPLWRFGFLLFLIANLLGSSIQITTLPLIILSPLQAVGLVFNSVCSATILNEGFTPYSISGTVFVAVGALVIAWFGSMEEPNHSLDELLQLMGRGSFVCWILLSCTAIVLILAWINVVRLIEKKQYDVDHLPQSVIGVLVLSSEKFRFIKGCLYGVVSGTLSAHSLLLAKSAVELILNAVVRSNYTSFQSVECWIIIASFFILAITQLIFLNKGLRFVSTSVLYPLVFCIYNVTNIINGLVFYNSFQLLSKTEIMMIVLGTMMVLFGVSLLSWRLEDHSDAKESNFISEHTSLVSPVLADNERAGYVSFGSPTGELCPKIDDEPTSEGPESPSSMFKYGSVADHAQGVKGKRRSRRVLSYEQSELLHQLNHMDI